MRRNTWVHGTCPLSAPDQRRSESPAAGPFIICDVERREQERQSSEGASSSPDQGLLPTRFRQDEQRSSVPLARPCTFHRELPAAFCMSQGSTEMALPATTLHPHNMPALCRSVMHARAEAPAQGHMHKGTCTMHLTAHPGAARCLTAWVLPAHHPTPTHMHSATMAHACTRQRHFTGAM